MDSKIIELNRQLCKEMQSGVVKFKYRKLDGSTRIAIGTLQKDLLPKLKGTGRPMKEDSQLYFDVEKQSYRSFKKENLLEFESSLTILQKMCIFVRDLFNIRKSKILKLWHI